MIKKTLQKYLLGIVLITSVFVGGVYSTSALTIETLLVAGGGSGSSGLGGCTAGAGGAGGYLASTTMVISSGSYGVVVGLGGSPIGIGPYGSTGGNSTFNGLTAYGGGLGGSPNGNGGSGGTAVSCGGGGAGGTGVAGQGYAGGTTDAYLAGGGGGAGGVGTRGNTSGGAGGIGVANSISGSSVTYAVGGTGNGAGANGTANRGNGGAGNNTTGASGGSGGSGIFIARCLTSAVTCTGGTVTTDGLYTVVTFTTNGTLTLSEPVSPSNSKKYFGFFRISRFR